MSELKPHEFDRLLKSGQSLPRILLFYGPDTGLVSERAKAAAKFTGVPLDDPFAVTQLSVSDIQTDPGRLSDEVNSIGLFGGEKLIWVKNAGNERPLISALEAVCEKVPEQSYLIIEAGDLKKSAGMRKLASSNRNIASVACYADDARALNGLIDQVLVEQNLKISPAGRAMLLESLGGDRLASRNEIEKLALYCMGEPIIEDHHVTEIIGDASATSVDDAVDAVLTGNSRLFHAMTQKILSSKTPLFLLLQASLRQFQMLDRLKSDMVSSRQSASHVIANQARGVHFRRKPALETALTRWNPADIRRACERINQAVLQTRQNASIDESIALQALLSITLLSARSAASNRR